MANTNIEKILTHAVYAPSGDNSQPWRFKIHNLSVDLINLPDKDNAIFNFLQRGSYVAHGAVIENIKQLAPHFGFDAVINLFPEPGNPDLIARINFRQTDNPNNDQAIIERIRQRCTNRKKYLKNNLEPSTKDLLVSSANQQNLGKILFAETDKEKEVLAAAASIAEKTMLLYKPLHKAFFSMIRWDKKEEEEKRGGLIIDALELSLPQKFIFKWFSNWDKSKILRLLGLPAAIAKSNAKIYSSCSAILAILQEKGEKENFVNTGMLLQKIWLQAQKLGLSIQPIAGVLYLGQRLKAKQMPDLPNSLAQEIETSIFNIYQNFRQPSGHITMMFRLGKGLNPTAKSSKFLPEIS